MDARHTQIILVLDACIFTISDRTHERVTNYQPVVMVCIKTFFYDMIYRMNLCIKNMTITCFWRSSTRQISRTRANIDADNDDTLLSLCHRHYTVSFGPVSTHWIPSENRQWEKRNKRHTRMFILSTRIKREKKQYHKIRLPYQWTDRP